MTTKSDTPKINVTAHRQAHDWLAHHVMTAAEMHHASYEPEAGTYKISIHDACAEVFGDSPFGQVAFLMLFCAWNDAQDWCRERMPCTKAEYPVKIKSDPMDDVADAPASTKSIDMFVSLNRVPATADDLQLTIKKARRTRVCSYCGDMPLSLGGECPEISNRATHPTMRADD